MFLVKKLIIMPSHFENKSNTVVVGEQKAKH